MKFIFLGLGNHGLEYQNNRHNAGKIVLKNLVNLFNFEDFKYNKKFNAEVSEGKINGKSVIFVSPDTFMNNSGDVIKKMNLTQKEAKNLTVIYDDLDLAFNKTKFSFNRSSGGHKGLESIIKSIKTESFYRIRIGISKSLKSGTVKKPKGEDAVIRYVMADFNKEELSILKKISEKIKEGIDIYTKEGYDKSANIINTN